MEMAEDNEGLNPELVGTEETSDGGEERDKVREDQKELVKRITDTIRADKKHHTKAFERMRRDMKIARCGHDDSYPDEYYKVNVSGRHVRQKTNSLYAKNPKATARRRERMSYRLWDGTAQSITMATQMVMTAGADPNAAAMPGYAEAMALVQDFQQGYQSDQQIKKFGETLTHLFSQAMTEQQPLDFKTAMKRVVRRACTTSVAYVEVNFQRETGPDPITTAKLEDARGRLAHMKRLIEDQQANEGAVDPEDEAELAELQASVQSMMNEPHIVLREGLVYDYPQSTRVIPDRLCQSLVGFVGARHVTIEYLYTLDEIKEVFGVDIGQKFTPYNPDGCKGEDWNASADEPSTEDSDDWSVGASGKQKDDSMVLVWKHYHKPSGLVYYVADGYDGFLREPAAPDVFVSDFWPIYALTFNDTESEKELFPLSDISLIYDAQYEINRSRQGLREHRKAARPRFVQRKAMLDDEDTQKLAACEAFDVIQVNVDPSTKLDDVITSIKIPGVDPNLYEESPFYQDIQMAVGSAPARLGGLAKATATEAAIAEGSATADDTSGIDDLDSFLTMIARASGEILIKEMSPDKVVEAVGPGAVWPGYTEGFEFTAEDLMNEAWLEIEAGSTGKPNQAVEISNFERIVPLLLQTGGVSPSYLAREGVRRLDDRVDLSEAIAEQLPAIVAMNQNAQVGTGDPATDPNQQGAEGGDNTTTPSGPAGTGPAFGSNQV